MAPREFARLDLGSFVLIADRGMVSEKNLAYLQQEAIPYATAESLRRKAAHEGLSRPGRFKRVTPHLDVKEVKRDGAQRLLVREGDPPARTHAIADPLASVPSAACLPTS